MPSKADEALLQEIREDYRNFADFWREAREHRQKCLRYLCGDPWEAEDKKARADVGRPALNHDELNQYVNQGINNLQQTNLGIKVEPRGNGADDKTAELRQDKIRTIQYRSDAQDVFLGAARDMYEGAYGFFRLGRKYVLDDPDPGDPRAFDQEITLGSILNPDSVLYDPNCKERDWSDAKKVFVIEPMARADFKAAYPNAEKTDFEVEDMRVAKDWITDRDVLVAEYWRVETTRGEITKNGKRRSTGKKKVVQYITNGLEILDRIEQPGSEIPIPAMVGLSRYADLGGGTKQMLFGLVSLALDPQMSLAYLVSQETEEAGMTPKVPVRGWTGQFETDKDAHETANKVPYAFLQYDMPEWALERGIPVSLPAHEQFTPNFQQYEIAKDACRRAIQAAVGVSPLPTAAQRDNEKSGAALEEIKTAEAVGSLHFTAAYKRALKRAGRIIDSWMSVVYDTEREEWLHQADESRRKVRLNTPEPYLDEETGTLEHFPIGEEDHDLTVTTGPNFDSERDAVSEFLDNLIGNLGKLPIAPPQAAKLLALAIQMKDLGPKGDQMAEIIAPAEGDQSQQMAQMQAQFAQSQQVLAEMKAQLDKLNLERQGKVLDNQARKETEQMRIEADLAKAEITTKSQILSERLAFVEDLAKQLHVQAHERGMQAEEHAQAQQQAQQQAEAQQQQQQAAAEQQQQPPADGQVQQ